jgi:TonB family protein
VMAAPSLVVEAHIDPAGRVTEVDLPKKTGSAAIDEPTRNAVYQWVFEPTRDKQGRAIADVIFFEIDYR